MNPIEYIQKYLNENDIDGFIVFTNDDHGSEYVVDYYKARAFLSGFTGSAGTMLITRNDSYLWTDGRYFLQAQQQLQKTGTHLMKMGVENEVTLTGFIGQLSDKPVIAFDFTTATVSFVTSLLKQYSSIELVDQRTIIDEVWKQRPAMSKSKAYCLSDRQAGESVSSKLDRTMDSVKKCGCDGALVASLDDIAWLLNLRGNDIAYNPVNYAYFYMNDKCRVLYIDKNKVDGKVEKTLSAYRIELREYNDVYTDMGCCQDCVLIDSNKTNYALYNLLKKKKNARFFPTQVFKAIKNKTEIANIKKAHIEDGVAMVKFMYWLKNNVGKIEMDELSVEEKLHQFRQQGSHFVDLSFGTICGYGSNGAIVHYKATAESNQKVQKGDFLLVDSGGQYRYGTTDITRTFVLGKVSRQRKRDFTTVLKGHIALSSAIFPKGTTGYALDMLARMPMYQNYQDYAHGTGHGVGYLLNVHEGPQSITIRSANNNTLYPILPGVITSNEPGLYITGQYGIRHENMVLCVEKKTNDYHTFLGFEPLTFVPFDLDGIDVKQLNEQEKKWLNDYHQLCYRKLEKYLEPKLKKYLAKITRSI